ncbi:MAG TPA: hypothetical protein VJ250_09180, partial [Nitrososphaeraceae archaeon]|nr:hypothetical protein [Nitrososphaeraceae archaeon]
NSEDCQNYLCIHWSKRDFFIYKGVLTLALGISCYRSKDMNPYNEGFMVRPENSKNKNVVFACRPCFLDIHNRRESG